MMLEDTFLSIERQINDSTWQWVATDADWETKMHWTRLANHRVIFFLMVFITVLFSG